jgi:flagellar hook-basal body complex protein FliE
MVIKNKIKKIKDKQKEVDTILESFTYDQIEDYIDSNVIDLASEKEFLKKLAKLVLKGN